MPTFTATAAEARAGFSKIADRVSKTGDAVIILKNSRPWVAISPITPDSPIREFMWSNINKVEIDPKLGYAVLPAEWDDTADDGLYDDLV